MKYIIGFLVGLTIGLTILVFHRPAQPTFDLNAAVKSGGLKIEQ